MAAPKTPFYLPPGRLVGGSLHELRDTDQAGRKREHPQIYFAVAVPKTDARVQSILQLINQVAYTHYANVPGVKDQLAQGLNAPNFAWKVLDGDAPKHQGMEGYAGCWVFRFATSISPLKCGDSQNNPIDPSTIKCGYFVDVSGSVSVNELTDKNAGVYLNPNGVRLLGYGKEIAQGPSLGQMFADVPASLPAGASALPVATGAPLGGPAPMAQPAAPGGIGGAPAAPPTTLGGTPAPGGPGFANGVTPPPAVPGAPPPPPPGVMAAAPAVRTIEQIQAESAQLSAAAGWTHTPGYRPNATRTAWEADPTPGPVPTAAGMAAQPAPGGIGGAPVAGVSANPMPAAGLGVPAGAQPGQAALGTGQPGSPIASPTNVQPHPQFLQPPQSADDISAAIAAQHGVQHHPGWRFNPTSRTYEANPA
jgi:hypothetical protein